MENQNQWNKIFRKEGKVFFEIQESITNVAKLFQKRGIKKILDLGCGSGRHLVYLTKQGFDVSGIDISHEGTKIAKNWLIKEKLKADIKIGSIYEKLPYKSGSFDAIISTQTLHHAKIEKIRKLIKEIERIIKPRGLIFITVSKLKSRKQKISSGKVWELKKIAPRTYLPLSHKEKGLIHYFFTKNILRKEFKKFKIHNIWVEKTGGHYCLLGELK